MASSGDELLKQAIASLQAGNLDDAERLFKKVWRQQPKHAAALELLSFLLARLERYGEAEPYIKSALALNPQSGPTLYNYGLILKFLKRPTEALEQFSQALSINPNVAETWNNRGAILNELKRYDDAIADLNRAIALQPNYFEAYANKGNSLLELKRHDEAFAAFDKALTLKPDFAEAWLGRGNTCYEIKRHDEALGAYDKALTLKPDLAEAWLGRGNVLKELKRHDEALAAYDRALVLKPGLAEAWLSRGNVIKELKRYDEAFAAYDKALALQPRLAEAWVGRGYVLIELKRYDEALGAYEKALTLQPGLSEAWVGRGNVLFECKRNDAAIAAYDKALVLKPDSSLAWLGRGNVLNEFKCYNEALTAYDRALTLQPGLAEAWLGRGNVFNRSKRQEEAASAYAKVLELEPQYPFIKGLLLYQKLLCCDWNGIVELVVDIDKDVDANKRSADPFGYQAVAHSALKFKRSAEIYAADRYPPQTPLWRGVRYNNARIRVGYLSGEFRTQAISMLMAELFELHDKEKFEFIAFDNGWDDGSELRGRINKAFDTIVDISRLDDLQAAALIQQKQIDILVNLNGYFGEHRMRVFSYKPAPIQVSYLGYSATMGADYIDYIIADRYIIPQEQRVYYTERVIYLPDTFQVNDTKRQIVVRTPTRAELKLPETGFVFCCFNNNFKITPEIFDIWMRLLKKVDGSVLWLWEGNTAVSRNLRSEAEHRGVAAERIVFASFAKEHADYLARYRVADLFLDTLPFNAGTVANDALWAGLPLLTCSGQTYTARMAGSLLNAIRVPELITTNLEAYEKMAIDLATHPEKLALIKGKLADNRLTTPLFDSRLFTKNIEAAFADIYERHQERLEPDRCSNAISRHDR